MSERAGRDGRTRRRLVDAATRLFAERGFKYVTIRAICREARANVAAVNYHFRDKLGLYREVFEVAVTVVTQVTEEAIAAGDGLGPADRLRAFVRVHCTHMFAAGTSTRLQQLMHREMQDPSALLPSIIERVWRPRFVYLCAIVGELLHLPADDERVIRSAVSVHVQLVMLRPSPALDRMGAKVKRAFTPESVAEHITAFSLAGLEAYRPPAHLTRPAPTRRRA